MWFENLSIFIGEAIFIQGNNKIYNNKRGRIIHSTQLSSSMFFSLISAAMTATACYPW
jgi:hypothetical protein